MTCITPSNPDSIPFGESLDISASLATTSDGSLFADGRSMKFENQLEQFSFSPEPISSADQHRVNNTPFLTAQTAKSPQAVGKLWKEVENQNPIKKVMKRSFDRPYQAVSSRSDHKLSQSDMREMQSHSTPRTFGPPKPFKLTGNQGAYLRRRFIPPPPIAPLVAATADQVKSLADWDEEEVPEDFSEFFSEDIVNNASV